MNEFNPNCGKCGMLNSRGFCSLTACRYPANVIAVQPTRVSFIPKPTSWGDKIRQMTDEELADEFLDLFSAFYSVEWSKDTLLAWLKSPVNLEVGK